MTELFAQNPLLLLFIVAAFGYLFGNISYKGNKLGVSAVLFVGLFFGAIVQDANAPEILFQLGLVFFVYSIGLSSGPAFFKSVKQNGVRDILFALLSLLVSVFVAIGIFFLFGFNAATTTGIYAGATTNTPALAAVIEQIKNRAADSFEVLSNDAVVAYSFTYPMGVLAAMIAIIILEKMFKINYKAEGEKLRKKYSIGEKLTSKSFKILNEKITNISIRDLIKQNNWNVVFGRVSTKDGVSLIHYDSKFALNDEVVLVGDEEELIAVGKVLGEESDRSKFYDRREFDSRRIFVSNPKVAGVPISQLNLKSKYHAVITRIRRGDVDMLAKEDTVIELGDRIRFMARRSDLNALSTLFGDSYYESSKANLFSFGLGIAIGLLIGMIEFNIGENISFKLGLAGGPLVVGLILGSVQRTGNIVWTLPYSTNITLRQIGLILLLAVIGIRSGGEFISSLTGISGLKVIVGGMLISLLTALFTLIIGFKLLKIPFSYLTGFVSNQPAILEFAMTRSQNRIPLIGYTIMFPIALVMKIILAQALFLLLL